MSEENIFKDFVTSFLPENLKCLSEKERKEYARNCLSVVGETLALLWPSDTAKIYRDHLREKHNEILRDLGEREVREEKNSTHLEKVILDLKTVNLFQDVSDPLIRLIAENVTLRDLIKDEPFIKQTEVAAGLFIFDQDVRVQVERISSPVSVRNGLFGEEICMPGHHQSPVTCTPVNNCNAYFIPAGKISDLMEKNPDLRSLIVEKMINRTLEEQLYVHRELSNAEELRRITQEILDNIDQGTFSINMAGEIGENFTAVAAQYLGRKDLAGVPFADVALRHEPKALRNYYRALHMIFDSNDFDPEVIIGMLPTDVKIDQRIFRLNYSFVEDKQGFVTSLFVRMEDLTRQKEIEERERVEAEKEEREREVLDTIRQNVGSFINVLDEVEKTSELIEFFKSEFVDKGQDPGVEYKAEILRTLHGTKGLSSQFHLDGLRTSIHQLEGSIQEINKDSLSELTKEFNLLVQKFKKEQDYLFSLKDNLGDEIISILKGMSFTQDEFSALYEATKNSEWNIVKEIVLSKVTSPAEEIVQGWKKDIEYLATTLGKSVTFHLECAEGLLIERDIIKSLNSELRHIYRNCVDHGIEKPEIRKSRNKAETGQISVIMSEKSGMFSLMIKDDGGGLDVKRIIELARKNRNLDQKKVEEVVQSGKVWKILLMPGFSSVNKVTEISGRGVGMNAVEAIVNKLQGVLSIESEQGKGSQFNITLPMNIFKR